MSRRALGAVLALAALTVTAACGGSDPGDSGSSGSNESATKLTVYAAASLTKTFTHLGKEFENSHQGVKVSFSFGGSSDLVAQIQQGAPADVFASADTANMTKLTKDHLQGKAPQDFASNVLEIATPPDNPKKIKSFRDLAEPGTKVVVCAPEVPCGAATVKVEKATGVKLQPVSEEQAVTDVLGKVSSGEADAGLVYVTDVKGAGDSVEGVEFPQSKSAVNIYPITTLKDSKHAKLAAEFVDLVLSNDGQSVLAEAGFGSP